MTIGIDARMFGFSQTGIGVYIENLITNLIEIGKEFDFIVFANKNNQELPRLENLVKAEKNFRIVLVNSHWYSWKEQLIFPFQMARQKIDLAHFPHFNVPILYRGKFIATIHDLTPKYFPGHKAGKKWRHRLAFDFVFGRAVARAEKIIAVSNYTKNEILKFYPGVLSSKISVIHEGNPFAGKKIEISAEKTELLKKKYGISKPFIFYAGVWRNHKNLVGLLEAFKILSEKNDLRLVIGGKEDPYYPEARKTWERLGLRNKIILPGFISSEELPVFYKAAALAAVPSFVEGFGFVGLEAMSCGTPVAASNAGSLPEILGEAAVYFNPKNPKDIAAAMANVLEDENLRRLLVAKGFERIKKYDWKKMAEETLRIYRSIL